MARVLVLGGYGNAGREVVALLMSHTDAHVVVAGRSLERGQSLVDSLSPPGSPGASRLSAAQVDGADAESLGAALSPGGDGQRVDLLIAASSTSAACEVTIDACMAAGVDY
ncbi:MAG: saccharopine dehydrogenase NADP-binding domain-containing protein, partial [Actinomycetes bacterium]